MDVIAFRWARCLDDYRIISTRRRARKPPAWTKGPRVITLPRWTVEGAPDAALETAGKQPWEIYCPTEFPTLFQRFADMPPTPEGMCDFVSKFGPLEFLGRPIGLAYHATDLGGVLAHHAALRGAIDLFEAGDSSGLARLYNAGWGQIGTQLRARPGERAAVVFVPSSLIQFLWLQLALHAASDAKLLRCQHCGIPFRVGTGTGRRDTAKYCSRRCNVAAYNTRHGSAATLSAAGAAYSPASDRS